jgi:hypothetical protein
MCAMTDSMPTWLKDHLVQAGHISEAGLTRKARVRRCRCGASTIAGIDNNGLDTWLIPTEINTLGEVMALVEQRGTWEMRGQQLIRRHQFNIRARPAGTDSTRPVFAAHKCGEPIPAEWLHSRPRQIPEPCPVDTEEIRF